MKYDLKVVKITRQEDFVKEIELPETAVFYNCG